MRLGCFPQPPYNCLFYKKKIRTLFQYTVRVLNEYYFSCALYYFIEHDYYDMLQRIILRYNSFFFFLLLRLWLSRIRNSRTTACKIEPRRFHIRNRRLIILEYIAQSRSRPSENRRVCLKQEDATGQTRWSIARALRGRMTTSFSGGSWCILNVSFERWFTLTRNTDRSRACINYKRLLPPGNTTNTVFRDSEMILLKSGKRTRPYELIITRVRREKNENKSIRGWPSF